jgi:hypothetical protein
LNAPTWAAGSRSALRKQSFLHLRIRDPEFLDRLLDRRFCVRCLDMAEQAATV